MNNRRFQHRVLLFDILLETPALPNPTARMRTARRFEHFPLPKIQQVQPRKTFRWILNLIDRKVLLQEDLAL